MCNLVLVSTQFCSTDPFHFSLQVLLGRKPFSEILIEQQEIQCQTTSIDNFKEYFNPEVLNISKGNRS